MQLSSDKDLSLFAPLCPLASWPLQWENNPSITTRTYQRPHDSRLAHSQPPHHPLLLLQRFWAPSSLMHGSLLDPVQRVQKEHVTVLDVTPFLPWICIQDRPRGTSFHVGEQCCHAGQLVSFLVLLLILVWFKGKQNYLGKVDCLKTVQRKKNQKYFSV